MMMAARRSAKRLKNARQAGNSTGRTSSAPLGASPGKSLPANSHANAASERFAKLTLDCRAVQLLERRRCCYRQLPDDRERRKVVASSSRSRSGTDGDVLIGTQRIGSTAPGLRQARIPFELFSNGCAVPAKKNVFVGFA